MKRDLPLTVERRPRIAERVMREVQRTFPHHANAHGECDTCHGEPRPVIREDSVEGWQECIDCTGRRAARKGDQEHRKGGGAGMSGAELKAALREVLRDELPRLLAELREPAANDTDLLGVEAAAKRLGLGRSTVRRLASSCELASVKSGRRLLFCPADLDAYAEARRRSPEQVRGLAKGA